MEGRWRSDKTRPFRNIYVIKFALLKIFTHAYGIPILYFVTVILVLYTCARTHTLFLKSIPAKGDKGTPHVTHECGAISRHRSPQFNTRLRLQRVTAVNFHSRPIYLMHVTLWERVLNSRTAQFPNFPTQINATICDPFSNLSYVSFFFFVRFIYSARERNFSNTPNASSIYLDTKIFREERE